MASVSTAREILEARPLRLEQQDYSTHADIGFYNLEAAEPEQGELNGSLICLRGPGRRR
jgi:hypothetical protein